MSGDQSAEAVEALRQEYLLDRIDVYFDGHPEAEPWRSLYIRILDELSRDYARHVTANSATACAGFGEALLDVEARTVGMLLRGDYP